MTEPTFMNVAQKYELVTCAGEVRFQPDGRLQQRFEFVSYEDGKISGARQEWRDVPTVSNGERHE